jgi:hypothetical protein
MRKNKNNTDIHYPIDNEIQKLIDNEKYSEGVSLLYKSQLKGWPILKNATEALSLVRENKFLFNSYEMYTHYNPGRVHSTTADVSTEAIKKRQCFLCAENLPEDQKGVIYRDKYVVLCNPFPIFRGHLTVTNLKHKPQRIRDVFRYMLLLSKDINDYCFIYNGPEAGASAPDHQHFQACRKDSLPVIDDYEGLKNEYGEEIIKGKMYAYPVEDGLRKMFILESDSHHSLVRNFNSIYNSFKEISKSHVEPMMNIISSYEEDTGWKVIIFFRNKHRPDAYFKEGDDNITVSPATIDMGGVLVTPFEKDFKKIDRDILSQIYREVSVGKEEFEYLKTKLSE